MISITEQSLQESDLPGANTVRTATVALAVLGVATVVAFWPSIAWISNEWATGSNIVGHGILLAAVSLFLLIRSARQLNVDAVSNCWWALPLVLLLSLTWLLGHVADVVLVHTSAIPLLLLAGILTVLGRSVTQQLAFSILYIFFALPIWEHMRFVFQALTVEVVQILIKIVGIAALIDGSTIRIPAGTFGVARGCSGINFIVIALALAALYGHLFYKSWRARWILLGVAFVFALITNWVRVAGLIVIGDLTDMQSPIIHDHESFGWILFGIALLALFGIANRLGDSSGSTEEYRNPDLANTDEFRAWPATLAVICALAVGPAWAAIISERNAMPVAATIVLPEARSQWLGPQNTASDWQPEFAGASREALAKYDSDSGSVWLYNNVYLVQDQDRELVNMHNDIAGYFRTESAREFSLPIEGSINLNARDVVASNGGLRWRIWSWYEIDGHRESNNAKAKLKQALATLKGRPEAGTVAVATPCLGDCKQAGLRLGEFLQSVAGSGELNYSTAGAER